MGYRFRLCGTSSTGLVTPYGALTLGVWFGCFLLTLHPGTAESLIPVGVLGNSGESGDSLVRVAVTDFPNCASGVSIGKDYSLWCSGGDRINRLGLDGRLMASHPLTPQGSRVDSRTFALIGDHIYFFGRLPNQQVALFALSCRPGSSSLPQPAEVVCKDLPRRRRDWMPYCLSPQGLDGKVVIVTEPQELPESHLAAYLFDPETKSLKLAFSLPGDYPQGVAIDTERRVIYIGAFFGQFVGGQTHSSMYGITVVHPDGKPVSGSFPVACTKTPAVPTQFRGVLSLAGGALWDAAWYGFLARLDMNGIGSPGRVVQWHHELGYPTQVAHIAPRPEQHDGLLAITTAAPDALYLADWQESAQQLVWRRRVGCLPVITSLGISEEGWVTVGTGRCQAWWKFEDAADSVPRKAELHIAVTPGVFREERFLALAAQYQRIDLKRNRPVAAIFSPRVGGNNEAHRVPGQAPMQQPVGLSAYAAGAQGATTLFVSDAESKKIWQTSLWRPELKPDNAQWKPLPCADSAVEKITETATDIAALADGQLLVAVDGAIVLLHASDAGYRIAWQFTSWGENEEKHLGHRLRMCADGRRLLIADTDRHRVLLFDWTQRRVLGQLGVTDQAGADLRHLNQPTHVALSGGCAVIADQGNQRIVKVLIEK